MHTTYLPNGELTTLVMSQFPHGFVGHAVDVGASDGISVNSTYVLEHHHRWTVLAVEANPYFQAILKQQRALVRMCAVDRVASPSRDFHIHLENLEAYSSLRPSNHPKMLKNAGERWATVKVPVRTLDDLLTEVQFPGLDVLCVDVEGTEADVLAGIDLERWAPKVIVVECWDPGSHDALLKPHGYRPFLRHGDNDILVRQ